MVSFATFMKVALHLGNLAKAEGERLHPGQEDYQLGYVAGLRKAEQILMEQVATHPDSLR